MSRYQVHVLDAEPVSVGRGELSSSGTVGRHYQASLGTLLGEADTRAAAQRLASQHASSYLYGTAILDTADQLVDCGEFTLPASECYISGAN